MSVANVSRLCPRCHAENPLAAHICRSCGADIERSLALVPGDGFNLPALGWRQVGTTLAVGVAAVAIQVGRSLLRQWLVSQANSPHSPQPAPARAVQVMPATPSGLPGTAPPRITVIRKTWWRSGNGEGKDDWGSQQDVWEIYGDDTP